MSEELGPVTPFRLAKPKRTADNTPPDDELPPGAEIKRGPGRPRKMDNPYVEAAVEAAAMAPDNALFILRTIALALKPIDPVMRRQILETLIMLVQLP